MTNTPSGWPEKREPIWGCENENEYVKPVNETIDACLLSHNAYVESVNKDLEFLRDECAGLREHLRKAKEYYFKEKERVRGELSKEKIRIAIHNYLLDEIKVVGENEQTYLGSPSGLIVDLTEIVHRLITEALKEGEK